MMAYRRAALHRPAVLDWLPVLLLWLAACVGYFGAWVPHRAAGLIITGVDVAEYVKFLPPVMAGQVPVQREAFYLPLINASLIATLIASRRSVPPWWRLLLGAAAIPLALAMLPPAWSPGTLRLPEFRLQVAALLACLAALPMTVLLRYLPDRVVLLAIALLALAAVLWPAWSFNQVMPAIEDVYRAPVAPGWGFWLALAAQLGLALYAAARMVMAK
jgi:hypothetical protein